MSAASSSSVLPLQRLRPYGFEVLHDVSWPGRRRAAIDYVVVGPPGVFVMHTENWSGAVTVQAETLRQNGYSRVQQTEAVRRSALVVGLSLGASWAALVVPVICLIGSAELVPTQAGPVTVLSLDHLAAWLLSQPNRLTPPGVKQVVTEPSSRAPGRNRGGHPRSGVCSHSPPQVASAGLSVEVERRAVPRHEP